MQKPSRQTDSLSTTDEGKIRFNERLVWIESPNFRFNILWWCAPRRVPRKWIKGIRKIVAGKQSKWDGSFIAQTTPPGLCRVGVSPPVALRTKHARFLIVLPFTTLTNSKWATANTRHLVGSLEPSRMLGGAYEMAKL
jgi:hypothetical protein